MFLMLIVFPSFIITFLSSFIIFDLFYSNKTLFFCFSFPPTCLLRAVVKCLQLPYPRSPVSIGSTGIQTRSTCAPRRRTSTAVNTVASGTAGSRRWSDTRYSSAGGKNPCISVRTVTTAPNSPAISACTYASIIPPSSCRARRLPHGNPSCLPRSIRPRLASRPICQEHPLRPPSGETSWTWRTQSTAIISPRAHVPSHL